jgi:U3 small nucleolar ribonucleoprotein component
MAQTLKHIYFSVQAKIVNEEGKKEIQRVPHSQDDETGEHYFDFFDKKKAEALKKQSKKENPEAEFRVVKRTEIYELSEWS